MRNWVFLLPVGIILLSIAVSNHVSGNQQGRKGGSRADLRGRALQKGEGDQDDGAKVAAGGTEAPKHDYPFVVTIEQWKNKAWAEMGQGTIYNPWTVLTTATLYNKMKPLIDKRDIRIGAGSHNFKVFENTRQYRQPCFGEVHKGYKGQENNLAVLHLSEAFRFSKYVSNIQLAKPEVSLTADTSCRFGGFGAPGTKFATLQQKLPKLTTGCKPSHASIICTNTATCNGDEGAPLVCTLANRMFAYGIAIDVTDCNKGNSNYFAVTKMDFKWLNTTLEAGRSKCRTYYKF